MRADERIRVREPLHICLGCRSKSKKCDKQLTHIVRVINSAIYLIKEYERTLVRIDPWYAILPKHTSYLHYHIRSILLPSHAQLKQNL